MDEIADAVDAIVQLEQRIILAQANFNTEPI